MEKITDKMLLDKAIAFCDELLSENGVKSIYRILQRIIYNIRLMK